MKPVAKKTANAETLITEPTGLNRSTNNFMHLKSYKDITPIAMRVQKQKED